MLIAMIEQISKQTASIVARYLQLLVQRNFTEAERELERVKQGIKPTPWCKGYYNALEGMLVSLRSGDNDYLYINRLVGSDMAKIDELQKRFARSSKDSLQEDFDKGYFTAWVEYLQTFKAKRAEAKSLNGYISSS